MELTEKTLKEINRISILQRLIWGGEFMAYGIYLFIAHTSLKQATHSTQHNPNPIIIIIIFATIAFLCMLSALIGKQFILSRTTFIKVINGNIPKFIKTFLHISMPEADLENDSITEERITIYSSKSLPLYLMLLGCANTISILGLVSTFVTHELTTAYIFTAIALLVHASLYLNLNTIIEDALKEAKQYI